MSAQLVSTLACFAVFGCTDSGLVGIVGADASTEARADAGARDASLMDAARATGAAGRSGTRGGAAAGTGAAGATPASSDDAGVEIDDAGVADTCDADSGSCVDCDADTDCMSQLGRPFCDRKRSICTGCPDEAAQTALSLRISVCLIVPPACVLTTIVDVNARADCYVSTCGNYCDP